MDPHSADNCKCHKQTQPAQQTLSDMDFDRGIWNAGEELLTNGGLQSFGLTDTFPPYSYL